MNGIIPRIQKGSVYTVVTDPEGGLFTLGSEDIVTWIDTSGSVDPCEIMGLYARPRTQEEAWNLAIRAAQASDILIFGSVGIYETINDNLLREYLRIAYSHRIGTVFLTEFRKSPSGAYILHWNKLGQWTDKLWTETSPGVFKVVET